VPWSKKLLRCFGVAAPWVRSLVTCSSRLDNLAQAQWINYHYDDNYIDIAFSNVV